MLQKLTNKKFMSIADRREFTTRNIIDYRFKLHITSTCIDITSIGNISPTTVKYNYHIISTLKTNKSKNKQKFCRSYNVFKVNAIKIKTFYYLDIFIGIILITNKPRD